MDRALLGCILRMRQSNNGILQGIPPQAPRSDLGLHEGRKAIGRCPCTPQVPMEATGEKINVLTCPSKEIVGLKMMTPGSQGSHV